MHILQHLESEAHQLPFAAWLHGHHNTHRVGPSEHSDPSQPNLQQSFEQGLIFQCLAFLGGGLVPCSQVRLESTQVRNDVHVHVCILEVAPSILMRIVHVVREYPLCVNGVGYGLIQ